MSESMSSPTVEVQREKGEQLTTSEVAALLGINRRSVLRLIEKGEFPAGTLIDRGFKWNVTLVQGWIAVHPVKPKTGGESQ